MVVKGFRFGMLLQLAIGPVCVFVFNLGSNKGFTEGIFAVTGVPIIDALYILFSPVGVSNFFALKKHEITYRTCRFLFNFQQNRPFNTRKSIGFGNRQVARQADGVAELSVSSRRESNAK